MPTNASEGSQTATVTTEHTLSTETTAGNYVLYVDVSNLALGDILELRVKLKPRSTGTTRELFLGSYAHVQEQLIVASIPVSVVNEAVFTLLQATGTGRVFDWAVVDMS